MSLENVIRFAKQTYAATKISELKHRIKYTRNDKRMKQALDRFHKCNFKKPNSQIRKEMHLCKKNWGCYPLHYFRYELYRKDRQLSEDELISYVPEFFFYVLFLPFYDSGKYDILLNNKNIAEQIFRSVEIPQPHTICKLIGKRIFTKDLVEVKFSTVIEELKSRQYKKIYVKPVSGQGGNGIYIFHKNNNIEYISKDSKIFNDAFLNNIATENDYIIQAGLEQASEIAQIYPQSVNTFRIATENINGMVRILCAVLRIGRNGNEVDNASQDGIIVKINLETGEIGDKAVSEKCEFFDKHPDTNFVFKGYTISKWDQVKLFVEECARRLPFFTYVGWDIALTHEGPCVIEANLGFSLDLFQLPIEGLRGTFRIDNPYYYWKNRRKYY